MGWSHVGFVLVNADRFDAACLVYDAALADARARGSVFAFALASLLRGGAAYLRGALVEAEADLRLSIEACEANGLAAGLPTPFAYLANTLMERGEVAAAAGALERLAPGEELSHTVHLLSFRDSRARLRMLQGRTREGLAELLELGRRFEAIGGRNPAVSSWRSPAALALLELSEHEDARRLAAEEVELARRRVRPGRSARLFALPDSSREARRVWRYLANRSRSWRTRPPCSSGVERSRSSAQRSDARTAERRRATRCGEDSSWHTAAARSRSPSAPTPSWSRPARGPAASSSRASRPLPRASAALPAWQPTT
jgi:hypothetical protein